MLEARIQQHFFESADLLYQVADALSRPIANAALATVGCVTSGGKLLACGEGSDADLAVWLCSALTLRFERDRPPLMALPLGPGLGRSLSRTAPGPKEGGEDTLLAAQVRALGQPGDLLVVFAGVGGDDLVLRSAVAAAHGQDMSVVLLSGGEPGLWPEVLVETDVWIPVAARRGARVREIHLLALHAWCDAVDIQLLGEDAP
jgi:D-sedoheptulose 7-phosphate isomerase